MCNIKRIVFILLLIPSFSKAQDITGLWKGILHSDTTGKDLVYELAISQEGKKITGYSYTFFIIDDKVYHGLKKIKIKKVDEKYLIEDDDLIANNYPFAPPKGVRQITLLSLSIEDSIMRLEGLFKTRRTKEYHEHTGSVNVQRKNNFYKQSALIPHLQELGLAQDLSFVKEEQEKINTLAAIQNNKVEAIKNELPKEASIANIITKQLPQVEVTTPQNAGAISKIENTKAEKEAAAIKQTAQPQITTNKKQQVVIKPFETNNSNTPAANLANRKIEIIQSVYFASDSLDITLYDNGEVDGDTVSVIMNGQVIMPKVGLSTNAVRKKISTVNITDSIQLIMYAETLGSLPPNTGLLIVYDGKERYEIRFSGDMQKSSAIVFRRKQ
jgi:hypothetical protein